MKKFRSPALLIIGLAVFCALLGCGKWGYKGKAYYKPLSSSKPVLGPYTLGVLPAEDQRGNRQDSTGCVALLIPLVPYCSTVRERPENLHQDDLDTIKSVQADYIKRGKPLSDSEMEAYYAAWAYGYQPNFSVPRFLQRSLVKEFEHSRMFDQVIAVQGPQDLNQADFILKLSLLSSKAVVWDTGYMLSLPGVLMGAALGLPVGGFSQELALKLELFQAGQEKPIWTGRVYEKGKGKVSPYYRTGFSKYVGGGSDHHGQPLNELLSRGMAKATPALYDFLKKQPPDFWQELEQNISQRQTETLETGQFKESTSLERAVQGVQGERKKETPTATPMQRALEEFQKAIEEE